MLTNETLRVIKQRRSIRAYRAEQITDDEVQAVVEAGLYAPNAGGQAWHFTVVQNKALLNRINLAAKAGAREMAMPQLRELGNNAEYDCLYGAPTLILVSAKADFPIPLDADCAAATQNLLLAAESLGLGSCWIFFAILAFSSPEGDALRQALQLPDGYKPYASVTLGYKHAPVGEAPARKPGLVTYIR